MPVISFRRIEDSFLGEGDFSRIDSLDSPKLELIAGQEDDRRMTFFKQNFPKGILLLVLTASTPSSARLFLSHSQDEMDAFYPPLPHDTRLAYAVSKGDSSDSSQVLITWKVVERIRQAEFPLVYTFTYFLICGTSNLWCMREGVNDVEQKKKDDSGRIRSAEANRYRFCAIASRRVPDWAVCGELNEVNHCLFDFGSGKRYFITVFVRDSLRGSTSSYETLEVNLKRPTETNTMMEKKVEMHSSESMFETNLLHDGILETALTIITSKAKPKLHALHSTAKISGRLMSMPAQLFSRMQEKKRLRLTINEKTPALMYNKKADASVS
uniref:Fibronectin type-III domain-containing protein n=1 Tax=Angiostrongylus cantonensis TaxID=6313 RepID=A0A0K0DH61_ANGCA